MKKLMLLLFAILLVGTVQSAWTNDLNDELVAYYNFTSQLESVQGGETYNLSG